MSEQKKPAGWKSAQGTFWLRTGEQKCKQCLHISPTDTPAERAHKRSCDEFPKDSRVTLDEEEVQQRQALQGQRMESPIDAELRRVEKADAPEKSLVWQEWCRRGPCINCGKPPRSTCSHEGSGIPGETKGIGQKRRDTLGTSKCWEPCHRIYTGEPGLPGGCLPDPRDSERKGKLVLRSREESLDLIHKAQEERLRTALDLLPPCWRREALSAGIAKVPEAVLKRALLTGDADDRLAEALDLAGEEPI